jgi:pyruvate,water dikinase
MMTEDRAIRAHAAGLISLDDPACEAPERAGNKAATLAALRRAGFDVPAGTVVSADAFSGADEELPAAVRAELLEVPDLLGPGPWAVRSSSRAEDSQQASFAGQFETLLDVDLGVLPTQYCAAGDRGSRIGSEPTAAIEGLAQWRYSFSR